MNRFSVYVGICAISLIIGTTLHYFGPPELTGAHTPADAGASVQIPEENSSGQVTFQLLAEGTYSVDVAERKNFAVSSAEDLERLWQMAYGENAPPVPYIDFENSQVIGVFMGDAASGGHAIRVERIIDDNDTRMVYVTLEEPGESCMTTQALTRPFQLVQVPWSGLYLSRTDLTAVRACP